MHTKIKIERLSLSDKDKLADKWKLLERVSLSNIFLSWQWIGSWLDMVTGKLFLIEAYHGDKVVGLGVFVEKNRKVFGCFSVKQWWLHRTGEQNQDQIWIEYNDFLLDQSCAEAVRKQMIHALTNFDPAVNEVVIGLSSQQTLDYFTQSFEGSSFLEKSLINTNGYLASLSSYEGGYLTKVLSKNTRSQIARSTKILQSQGELKFEVFSSPKNLKELFPKIAKIHIAKWKATNESSGFSNPLFEKFHQSIITNNVDGMTQVAVLTLNEVPLGYLVNFVYKNQLYFYLSALEKDSDNKVKIGMTLHHEALKYYSEQGIDTYDFLGGDARYKQSLSDKKYELEMKCYYQSSFIMRFEQQLKTLKMKSLQMVRKHLK